MLRTITRLRDFDYLLQKHRAFVCLLGDDEHMPCPGVRSFLETYSKQPEAVTVLTVDTTQFPEMLALHRLRRIPAIVAYNNGGVVFSIAHHVSLDTLRELLDTILRANPIH